MMHPKRRPDGRKVSIQQPHIATHEMTWSDPEALATFVPGGRVPNHYVVQKSELSPGSADSFSELPSLSERIAFSDYEPAFESPVGLNPASGAVIIEDDCRVWIVSPTNRYAGYSNTFPKGGIHDGRLHRHLPTQTDITLSRTNAIKEVFEETGLHIQLTGFLCDCSRQKSYTRYYLAKRIGGSPADMGWESQATHLVPLSEMNRFVDNTYDIPVIRTIFERMVTSV